MEGIKPMKTPQTKPADLNDLFRATDARARGRRVIRPLSRANKRNKSSNHTITMSTPSPKAAKSSSRYSIGMFSAGEARCDRWRSEERRVGKECRSVWSPYQETKNQITAV